MEKICVASKIAKFKPARFTSMAAAIPETPAPMIAMSRSDGSELRFARKSGSCKIAFTAFAPVSEENFKRGMPVRSPVTRTPGTEVVPSSFTSGSFSIVPAGQRVWSHRV